MASNERIRKYLDAGSVLGRVQRGKAEEIVRELVNAGDIRRDQAQEWVDTMVDRSRNSSEQLLETVRREVAAQLKKIDASSLEHIADQVAEIMKRSAETGRSATKSVSTRAEKTATDVRKKTEKAAKDVRTQTEKTVKGVRTQAGKAATDVRKQAGKTVSQAREAAKKVTPEGRHRQSADKPRPRRRQTAAKSTAKKTSDATKKDTAKKADSKKAAS